MPASFIVLFRIVCTFAPPMSTEEGASVLSYKSLVISSLRSLAKEMEQGRVLLRERGDPSGYRLGALPLG